MMKVQDPIAYAYSGQDGGATLPYFVGRQYGSGWLRNLARIAFPILKKAVGVAGNIASNTAEDLIENRKSFTQSLKDNALNEANRVLTGGSSSASINKAVKRKAPVTKHHTIFKRRA